MGIGKGACSECHLTRGDPFARFSGRCWKPFPRKLDLALVPNIVAKINVCDLDTDLNSVNQGSALVSVDCFFSPDNDRLFSVVSVFKNQLLVQDGFNRMIFTNSVPTAGFVTVWFVRMETDGERVKESENHRSSTAFEHCFDSCSPAMFTYSPQPCCSFSPNGEVITAILNSGKDVLTMARREDCYVHNFCMRKYIQPNANGDHDDCDVSSDHECDSLVSSIESLYETDDDIWFESYSLYPRSHGRATLCGRVQCAVYSPCGTKLVTLNKVSLSTYMNKNVHELSMWDITSSSEIKCSWSASCEVICPSFSGAVSGCRFSLNSKILGFSSNHGFCLFVWADSGEIYSLIRPTENQDAMQSTCDFDFDPTLQVSVAVVWRYGHVKVFRLQQQNYSLVYMYSGKDDEPFSNCIKYSMDGLLIAVGTMAGQIHILSANTGSCIHCLDIGHDITDPNEQTLHSVCFARSCQELMAAYNDGYVRIWQLPRVLNLQHICRLVILNHTIMNQIDKLPLPKHIKSYLLFDQI